jgi:tetratricopeptide (TPR) repeat protein
MVDPAVAVSEIFARLDPEDAWNHRCNAAMSLAMGGHLEEARQRVEENLADFPDHHLVLISSAQAFADCGDLDRAKGLYSRALDVAQEGGDPDEAEGVRDWFERFFVEYAPDDPDRGMLEEQAFIGRRRVDFL